ncbi:MAG TPA: hypothetical protein VKA46_12520 [Gemmataceae bacterium]|nr:hypothetical protein [Gemmataceae bacterium]
MRTFPHKLLLLLALVYTLINAFKPLTIDDTAYHSFAARAADKPLDPYGFSAYWWGYPEVANEVLAPPLLPYYWAPAICLFGERPFLWKMSLLPLAVLFAYAIHDLGRRFARGLELPLVALTLFSPTFLPTFNLMLDVPATALSVASVAVFCRACDRSSFVLAALAGLVAGFGMEMKYTVFLAPAAMLLYAVCLGRLRFWPAAAVVAAQVFLSWEFLMSLLYGESHFLLHTRERTGTGLQWARLMPALVTNLGSAAWPAAMVALVGLGARWRGLLVAGVVGLLSYAAVACLSGDLQRSEKVFGISDPARAILTFEEVVFGTLGAAGILIGVAAVWRLSRPPVTLPRWGDRLLQGWAAGPGALWRALAPPRPSRVTLFLLLWLALEVVGYVALSPTPTIRRLMGVVVVIMLIVGRVAALRCRSLAARRVVYGIAAYSAVLGLLVFCVDLVEALAERSAVEEAARLIRERGEGGTIWYIGHWGFQYYAEREGMRPISAFPPDDVPIPMPPRSALKKGDWLVLPEFRYNNNDFAAGVHQQLYTPDKERTKHEFPVIRDDPIPLQTIMTLYSGYSTVRHHEGPRLQVEVRRVLEDHDARR